MDVDPGGTRLDQRSVPPSPVRVESRCSAGCPRQDHFGGTAGTRRCASGGVEGRARRPRQDRIARKRLGLGRLRGGLGWSVGGGPQMCDCRRSGLQ